MNNIWITWENQRRNEGICAGINMDLHTIISKKSGLKRYMNLIIKTFLLIIRNRPKIVVAQNPSIVLSFFVIVIKPFFRMKVIIDSHNAGISPLEGTNFYLNCISKYIQKKADLTIVSNHYLKLKVEQNKGKAFVLPDKIPKIKKIEKIDLPSEMWNIVFICTFSNDEPFNELFDCAKHLQNNYAFYVTGEHRNKIDLQNMPKNIFLLGYVSDAEYWGYLQESDIIIDLTTRNDCLVCGAYEGVAVEKPLILSDNKPTKELFNKGCIYVKANSRSIQNGVLSCIKNYDKKLQEIKELKSELEIKWKKDISILNNKISEMDTKT